MKFWAGIPKPMVGLSVALIIGSGVAAAYGLRSTDFDWEHCTAPRLAGVRLLEDLAVSQPVGEVATSVVADLDVPVAMAVNEGIRYVATLSGTVFRLTEQGDPIPVLDLSDEVLVGEEQGLLGIAFAPDAAFAYLTFTDHAGAVHLVEYSMPNFDFRRTVLTVSQPQRWHNGGHLAFGPDGFLYVGLGDGGTSGDQYRNGQNLDTMLGTIIRIDPRPFGDEPYAVPADNPFVDGAVPEIFVFGLRNPWTFSFDEPTGDLWIGDVGQNCVEEIDVVPAGTSGQNFGWSAVEGNMRFRDDVPEAHVPPVLALERGSADCSVIWGGRYQGAALPALHDRLLFADYCLGKVMALAVEDGAVTEVVDVGVQIPGLVGFGFDADGEVYLLSQDNGVVALLPG